MKNRKTFRFHNPLQNGGFSFLEVMVAMSIIAIAITAVFRLQSQSIVMSNEARFYTIAPLLAQKVMAEYDRKPDKETGATGDFGEEYPGYAWKRAVEDIEIEAEAFGEEAEGMKRIEVTVSLDDGKFNYSIRTYRLDTEDE